MWSRGGCDTGQAVAVMLWRSPPPTICRPQVAAPDGYSTAMAQKVVASIEARMTSTRLPGKVLMECLGKPMLELMVERVRASAMVDDIVIATTTNRTDDPVEALARRLGVGIFRGSEHDVVARVTEAHQAAGSDIVVQLTGDCPLIDPDVIDLLVRLYAMNSFDYVSNVVIRSYPVGMDTQVSSLSILQKSLELAETPEDHEHLYRTIYSRAEQFSLYHVVAPPDLTWPELRLTLDTAADFQIICAVFEALYPSGPDFRTADILKLVHERPDLPWLAFRGGPLRVGARRA